MIDRMIIVKYFHISVIVKKLCLCFFVAIGFFCANPVKAQSTLDLVINGDAVYQEIQLTNTSGYSIQGPTVKVKLADNVHLVSNTINNDPDLGNGATLSLSGGTTNEFTLKLNGLFPDGSTMKIRFKRMAVCSASPGSAVDKATISLTGGGILEGNILNKDYAIWGPMLVPQSIVSNISSNIIAGQEVLFTAKIQNTGLHSYASNFLVHIIHDDFETPQNLTLGIDGNTYVVQPGSIKTVGSKTTITVTPVILAALGRANGKFNHSDILLVNYVAVPKLKCNGGGTSVQVKMKATTSYCDKAEVSDASSDLTLNLYSPGFILSTFEAERKRTSFDFPDALDNGTVNGAWIWDGGTANPFKNYVRNGDTLELCIQGDIRTSSLLPEVNYLYAAVEFDDGSQNDFLWIPTVKMQVKKEGSLSWNSYDIMALSIDNNVANTTRYKIKLPDVVNLSTDDQVKLAITAVVKQQDISHGLVALKADVFATKDNTFADRYPTDLCKATASKSIEKIAIEDLFAAPLTITGSCVPVASAVTFKSVANTSSGCINCFSQEFRSNHYVKELLVYVPSEGTIKSGTITIGSTPFTYTTALLPTPTIASFTDGSVTYSNAKCYTFSLESKYGVYGSASLFEDEKNHEVTASFDVVFDSPTNTTAQNSAILYVVKPANPSVPSAALASKSAIQKVKLPSISPHVVISIPPGREVEILPLSGEVVWRFTVQNPSSSGLTLDNLSLKIEHLTGGSFSNVTVTQMRPGLASHVVTGENVNLLPLPSGATHTIEIKGIVNQACNAVERINAILIHKPCGANEMYLATEELAFKAPVSAIQVSSVVSSTNLTMCNDFEVTMVVSALRGTVKDPIAKLVLPKNSLGTSAGIDFIGVRKEGAAVDFPYAGSLEELTFDLNAIAGISQLTAGQEVTLKIRLNPNCDFAIDSRLTSFAYGKNFCNSYNSEGSGKPVYTDILTINGLQSSYKAQLALSQPSLKFDKSSEHKRKSTKLTITKTSGGNVGSDDFVSLSMPLLINVPEVQFSGAPVTLIVDDTSIPGTRRVSWRLSETLSTAPVSYDIVFELSSPSSYTDDLDGTISAIIINKVQGLPCGLISCPSLEAKAGEGSIAYKILDLFPGLAKDVSFKANSLMKYTFTYTFTLKNFGDNPIENVRLSDNLSDFHNKGVVSAISIISSSPTLYVNSAYDGLNDAQLLASNSRLLGNEIKTVTLSFDITFDDDWRNKTFTISNTALVIGSNENGTEYQDKSNNGTNPDLTDTPTLTEPINTNPPEVIVEPVIVVPPPGFAITANGVECFEGNSGTQTPLEFEFKLKSGKPLDYRLCFTVYTRDSLAMVRDNDYLKLVPKVLCIEAGSIRSGETVTTTIVGDDKYEQDEPFVLQVKESTEPMKCKSPVITILNDDPVPNVTIDDITLDGDKGAILNVSDFSRNEGTSTTERTKFNYCVKLNVPAPQALELKVVAGNDSDNAKSGSDYYYTNEIVIPIAMGEDKVCFTIEVEPDAMPENDEVFTLSYSLGVSGTSFLEEVRRTIILNDDEFTIPSILNSAIIFCQNDDVAAKASKIQKFVDIVVPAEYVPRWYKNQTTAIQVTPDITSTQQGAVETFYLGYYNPAEDYESPIGKRSEVNLTIQSEPQWSITTTPASPMKLIPGQSALVTVEPNSLPSYSYTLNGVVLVAEAVDGNELRIARSKLTALSNQLDVAIVDAAGCGWSKSVELKVEQVELPNAFIPEGNNTENQKFLKGYDIRVFNRWGHLLYSGADGWDGRYRGSYVASGTYYYVLNLKQEDGTAVEEKGFVMVVSAEKK